MGQKADKKTVTLRIPSDLHSVLLKMAESEMRSLNAQVVLMLSLQTRIFAQSAQLPEAGASQSGCSAIEVPARPSRQSGRAGRQVSGA